MATTLDRPKDRAETKSREPSEAMPPFDCSIAADEVVPAGTMIELEFRTAVDPQSAQGAITLEHDNDPVPVTPELADGGRTVRIGTPRDMTGTFALTVSELLGKKGERLVDHFRVPFVAMQLFGEVPRGMRIEHVVRLALTDDGVERLRPGERSKGRTIDAMKVVSRKGEEASDMAFDEKGAKFDLGKHLTDAGKRRADKYGRIHPTLFQEIEKAKPGTPVPIVIWPRIELPAAPYEKASDRRTEEPPEGERKLTEKLREAHAHLSDAASKAGLRMAKEANSDPTTVPCISTEATVEQIRELSRSDAVGAIFFDDRSERTDLANSISVAHSDQAHLAGFDGTGIKVAVWESGPSNTSNLVFAGRYTSSPSASDHARLTSAIIKNTERGKPHGHAPDCELYSANSGSTAALKWAVQDKHCTVVSQSFHRDSEPKNAGLQSDDVLKDWLVLRYPYPTIVQAAGNFWKGDDDNINPPESEYVNHKGFNSLAIGNHDDTAATMSGDSVFRNPSSSHGDRELPELAANGTAVSANQQTMSGTSFAAPATAGVAALIQDVDPVLCSWPEGCRAILLAAAGRNIRDNTWWRDVLNRVDTRDGSGALDAMGGVTIARQRRSRNAPATRHGWDVGTISSAVIGANKLATFIYRVSVPPLLRSPKVKVALAWDGAVSTIFGIPLSSHLTVDLDLIVRDSRGNQVASSASWDNSYEIAEFDGRPGETYDIIVRRWSGTENVWYGIAWTVRGFTIFLPPVDIETTVAGVA